MPSFTGPADPQGHRDGDRRHPDDRRQLEVKRDVLMPDLRKDARAHGQDPEEVDPLLAQDEDALRLTSLGGSTNLD
jgi:hypothetical protein